MNLTDLIGSVEKSNPQPAGSRRVIVWGQDDLLVRAVGSYLQKMAWDVIQVLNDADVDRLIQETKQIHPEVVILCQYKAEDAALVWRLVDQGLCLKVVTICMESNLIHMYSKQDVVLRGAIDLLSVIDPGNFSNCPVEKEVSPTEKTTPGELK